MSKTILSWFNNEYEKILHCGLFDSQKDRGYVSLMSEMEVEFRIPMLRNEEWEQQNKDVFTLYRKMSMSRKL
ncbi:hypothetical protein [Oceanobacillus sojae]|uniref:hypothetical protein n=1 Tax=Oceanobacillus sojae TaxID=582851 RepID=UPI0021A5392B|nr:hypothetical protein [Oceanobacillus sojae]MCT1905259.1 hypothetical protein [Oceanobacillus sojae]